MNKYDPSEHRTPPEGNDETADYQRPHRREADDDTSTGYLHRRHYDPGLVTPPVSLARSSKFIAAVVFTCAVAFFAAFWAIGRAGTNACEDREDLSRVLRGIILRSDSQLQGLVADGTITKVYADRTHRFNLKDVRDLKVTC